MTEPVAERKPELYGRLLVTLLRTGVIESDGDEDLWHTAVHTAAAVRDYVKPIGLEFILDEAEGYGYLRSRARGGDEPESAPLIQRVQLGYRDTILLVLLRRRLDDADAAVDNRLVLTFEEMQELFRTFDPDHAREAHATKKLQAAVNRLVDLRYLRQMTPENRYEVRRLIRAFIDADTCRTVMERIKAHIEGGGKGDPEDSDE